jgi:hypothetical protein
MTLPQSAGNSYFSSATVPSRLDGKTEKGIGDCREREGRREVEGSNPKNAHPESLLGSVDGLFK